MQLGAYRHANCRAPEESGHGLEVRERVVGEVLERDGIDRHCGASTLQNRITIRRRMLHRHRGNYAISTRHIIDNEGLSQ